MKKILKKDLLREIRNTFTRFISIALLVAIGMCFFIGLKSAPNMMLDAGNKYFEKHRYEDIEITTTSVWSDKNIDELKKYLVFQMLQMSP